MKLQSLEIETKSCANGLDETLLQGLEKDKKNPSQLKESRSKIIANFVLSITLTSLLAC